MDANEQNKLARIITYHALKFAGNKDTWIRFGYKKHPNYGTFIQFFRKNWKFELEKRIYRELIYLHIAYNIKSQNLDKEEVESSLIFLVGEHLSGRELGIDVWKDFDFESRSEFNRHSEKSIKEYIYTSGLKDVFLTKIKFGDIPDGKTKAEIVKGIIDVNDFVEGEFDKISAMKKSHLKEE